MSVRVGYHWHLRRLMAERDMFATTDLGPLLAERGVVLSREQVYRLVTGTPQRLSLTTLAALCDILACTPSDLVEPYRSHGGSRRAAGGTPARSGSGSGSGSAEPPPRSRRTGSSRTAGRRHAASGGARVVPRTPRRPGTGRVPNRRRGDRRGAAVEPSLPVEAVAAAVDVVADHLARLRAWPPR